MPAPDLAKLFKPKSVAVIGASTRETAAGWRVTRNLKNGGFKGGIYPINPRYEEVLGLRCYPDLKSLPETPDAVFIGIPAEQVASVLEEAGKAGVKAAVMNASGFADGGPEGIARQKVIEKIAADYGIAVCGPNNTGFINLVDETQIATWPRMPNLKRGSVAAVTQSGSVAIALGQEEFDLGLAYVITAGNEAVCGVGEYLDYLVRDPRVKVVALYIETIRNPVLFAKAAREAARRNVRIVALKVGATEQGMAAVAAHTGALAGDDKVYDAYFRRLGVVRVHDLDELVESARLFSFYPDPPRTKSVVPMTFSGGQAGVIADLGSQLGLDMPQFAPKTLARIKPAFPVFATPRNPLDAWGLGWDTQRFTDMVQALADDASIGAVAFAVDMPELGGADTFIVEDMLPVAKVVASKTDAKIVWINNMTGGGYHKPMLEQIKQAGFPYLRGLRTALNLLHKWTNYEKPGERPSVPPMPAGATKVKSLAEPARFKLMADAGVPMCACTAAATRAEAIEAAKRAGFPVVLKATAPNLPHKTELDLIRLNLKDADAVGAAFDDLSRKFKAVPNVGEAAAIVVQPMAGPGVELIVGVRNDPRFGSAIAVGLGGTFVEILREARVEIGPVTPAEARKMLDATRAGTILNGFRGKGPYDIDAAAEAIASLSRFGASTMGTLSAVEVNPLIVLEKGKGAVGVDVLLEPVKPG
ncbi:MAG: acetate--CoA ligase family protein [Alphaproteobacteria bacterium]